MYLALATRIRLRTNANAFHQTSDFNLAWNNGALITFGRSFCRLFWDTSRILGVASQNEKKERLFSRPILSSFKIGSAFPFVCTGGRRQWITYHLGWASPLASSLAQSSKLIHSRPFHWGKVWEEVDEMKRLFLSFFLMSRWAVWSTITWITCSCVMHDCGRAPHSQNTKSKPTKGKRIICPRNRGIGADVGRSGGKILCTLVPPMLQGDPT